MKVGDLVKFQEACKTAVEYFLREWGDGSLDSVKDIENKWLFYGGQGGMYGRQGITIDKKSGEIDLFYLPDEGNFELLDKAVEISVPKEFKYNNTTSQ